MDGTAEKLMTADEFLLWCLDQEDRYELDNGFVINTTGASNRHGRIVVNIVASLH